MIGICFKEEKIADRETVQRKPVVGSPVWSYFLGLDIFQCSSIINVR